MEVAEQQSLQSWCVRFFQSSKAYRRPRATPPALLSFISHSLPGSSKTSHTPESDSGPLDLTLFFKYPSPDNTFTYNIPG